MESSLKCFHLSHLPRSLLFVQRVRVRKTLQRKIMNLKEKRTAYFSRGGSWRVEYPLVWRKCELPMPTAEVMGQVLLLLTQLDHARRINPFTKGVRQHQRNLRKSVKRRFQHVGFLKLIEDAIGSTPSISPILSR